MLTRIGFLVLAVVTATRVNAQVIEIQPFAGGRFGGGFTVQEPVPGGDRDVAINFEPGLAWGATFGFLLGDLAEVEFLWSRQESAISAAPTGASKATLFDVSMGQYHGNLLFHFFPRDSRMRPYILIGAGGTNVDPDAGDLEGTTQFSFGLGAGLKAYMSRRVGARIQFRYAPTHVSALPALWCDVFSSCQAVGVADYANQAEISAGLMFRF